MEISDLLFKPLVDRLVDDYQDLENEFKLHQSSEEINTLKEHVLLKISELRSLRCAQQSLELSERDLLRSFKLDLRFTQRRWKRQILNNSKLKRIRSKEMLIPANAA